MSETDPSGPDAPSDLTIFEEVLTITTSPPREEYDRALCELHVVGRRGGPGTDPEVVVLPLSPEYAHALGDALADQFDGSFYVPENVERAVEGGSDATPENTADITDPEDW